MSKPHEDKQLKNGLKLLGAGVGTVGLSKALLNDREISSINGFENAKDRWAEGEDPRQALREYVQHGNEVLNTKPLGINPINIVKHLRNSHVLSHIDKLKPWAWHPGAEEHYNAFQRGPLTGYLQLAKETSGAKGNEDVHGAYDSLVGTSQQSIFGRPNNEQIQKGLDWSNLSDKLKSNPQAMKAQADSMKQLMDDTQSKWSIGSLGKHTPGKLDEHFSQKLNDYANRFTTDGKYNTSDPVDNQAAFNGLDGYIKNHDHNLWVQKQYADYSMGHRMPDAGSIYGNIMGPFTQAHDVLKSTGLAAAGAGVGLTGYALYKKLKEHLAKKKAQSGQIALK